MSMVKHVGLHNAQSIVVVLRKIEGQEHMCLVTYVEKIPPAYKESIFECLNSPEGQGNEDGIAHSLELARLPDGRPLAEVLHKESYLKKVATNQVFLTPNKASKVKLDEINKYLDTMNAAKEGNTAASDAVRKWADQDASGGLKNRKRRDGKVESVVAPVSSVPTPTDPLALIESLTKQSAALLAAAQTLAAQLPNVVTPTAKVTKTKAKTVKKAVAKKTHQAAK